MTSDVSTALVMQRVCEEGGIAYDHLQGVPTAAGPLPNAFIVSRSALADPKLDGLGREPSVFMPKSFLMQASDPVLTAKLQKIITHAIEGANDPHS